jgi:hypothetical protein
MENAGECKFATWNTMQYEDHQQAWNISLHILKLTVCVGESTEINSKTLVI